MQPVRSESRTGSNSHEPAPAWQNSFRRGAITVSATAPQKMVRVFISQFRPSRRALKPAPGPNLAGIVGRKKASLEGFPYSEAMRAETGTWTTEELNIFLADPFSVVPGTAMGRGRQTDRAARVALIAYLARLAAE